MRRTVLCTLAALMLCALPALAGEQAAKEAPAPEAAPAEEKPAESAAPAKTPSVARAQFTSAIAEREPVDALSETAEGSEKVYFFTEVNDCGGTTITHKWLHGGVTIAEVQLDIGGDRWRTRSSKKIHHLAPGTLEAQVIDASGAVLARKSMEIKPAPAPAAEAPATAPTEAPAAAPAEKAAQ